MEDFEIINLKDFNNAPNIEQFLILVSTIDSESEFMLFDANERKINSNTIQSVSNSLNDELIVYLIKSKESMTFQGYISGIRKKELKVRHSISIAMGVKKEAQGKKFGNILLSKMISEFRSDKSLIRLFLHVMVVNQKAINLYKKNGFEIEGVLRKNIYQKGEFIDDYVMSIVK